MALHIYNCHAHPSEHAQLLRPVFLVVIFANEMETNALCFSQSLPSANIREILIKYVTLGYITNAIQVFTHTLCTSDSPIHLGS